MSVLRRRHREPTEPLTDYERSRIVAALTHGPWAWHFELHRHVEAFTDDELRDAFESWARDEREWSETTYAFQRFVVGLSRDDALAAAAAAIDDDRHYAR